MKALEQARFAYERRRIPRMGSQIRRLLRIKGVTQTQLADILGVSPPTVSRWLGGRNEPTPQAYVALGNLCEPPDAVYFWERAGVQLKHSNDALERRSLSSSEVLLAEQDVVAEKRVSGLLDGKQSVVAIPLVGVCAYADEEPPHERVSLAQAAVQEVITAPAEWCPHPSGCMCVEILCSQLFKVRPSYSLTSR